jgi:hypothetical protein
VKIEPGKSGQFDILADGELIAARGGNMLTRLIGGGWPDEQSVVEKLRGKLGSGPG